ncbi:MAG TPA: oligosaccharide flippase family protein, partial [Polyangiaceae bacterium LLY-WYZ-15_(1-7)]|nr:oligosaccharide flippase family protein [Polyangiaceae bacterium LLY-WYZ-15_(1-7)]
MSEPEDEARAPAGEGTEAEGAEAERAEAERAEADGAEAEAAEAEGAEAEAVSGRDAAEEQTAEREARYGRSLTRGALINVIGLLGKLLYPVLILVLTRLFGAELMGAYFLGLTVVEIGSAFVVTGWMDAATIYASHHVEDAETDARARAQMNAVVGHLLGYGTFLALAVAALVQLGAAPLIEAHFPDYDALLPGVYYLGWCLVPAVFGQVVAAAAKAHLAMEWDALVGGLRPILLLLTGVVVWLLDGGLTALFATHLVANLVLALVAIVPLRRFFDPRPVLAAMLRPRLDRALLAFSIPQGLNRTFVLYVTRLDTIMLAAFGTDPARLGWYATASYLTSNLQQIRIVFSTALAPLVARHHVRGERRQLSALISRTSRWTATLVAPAVLILAVLRDDVLALVDPSYVGPESAFVLLLLVPPFASCAFGLAGNFVAYMGHSRWNLANSLTVAGLNTALNWALIPRYGLAGAAGATAISTVLVITFQQLELWGLEKVRLRLAAIRAPHLAFLVGVGALVALGGDPAHAGSLGSRLGLAAGLTFGFVA